MARPRAAMLMHSARLALVGGLLLLGSTAEGGALSVREAAGKRIYLEGASPTGGGISATVGVDALLPGSMVPCAGCHGDVGQGNATPGAPQLNDAIWLYGGTREQIASQLNQPRMGIMPAWLPKLGAVQVKELAAYVHSLGGGQ